MGGFFRFLLGGALGAALGIMFVKKQAVTKTSRTAGAPASAPGAGLASPSAAPGGAPAGAPAVAVTPEAAPAEAPVPAVVAAPEPAPAVAATDVTAAAVVAPEVAPEVVPAMEPAPSAPEAVAPPVPEILTYVAAAAPTPLVAIPQEAAAAPEVTEFPEVTAVEEAPAPEVTAPPEVAEAPEVTAVPEAPVGEEAPATYAPEPASVAAVTAAAMATTVAAGAPTVAPAAPPAPEEESRPAAWVIGGAAAAGLAHVVAKEEDQDVSPAPAAAGMAAAAAVDTQPSAPPAPPQMDWAAPVVEEAPVPMDASDSVVLVTPEVLEDPLPGSGWEPALYVEDEAELEEMLPVVPDDVLPYEGPQIELPKSSADEAWDAAPWPETAAPVAMAETATVQPELESAAPAPEEALPEYGAVPVEAAAEAAPGDDLKSRIEETRRRIREELDKPFATVDEESGADAPGGPAPIAAPAPVAAPAGAPTPVIGEPMRVSAGPANGATESPAAVAAGVAEGESGADYDAMRARIELTRSRLKAKAFDAMMAGESALLGRDPETSPAPARSATFDSEIEQTVDSTLREDDR